ncbi:hypothetical protein [Nocardioides nitrophenolicus]|uniref:hypothetical protein n=1 Tax=Nocardioides nitrophenolicus TaxID=60489 RepID=UPI0019593166|nr:hypothetical protein [Nocardioides nitrophenolicus]MBM7515675.1 uncharacterized membrane protein YhaH (DUF805 family) [Nocardioides nitrophenolicus]
MTDVRPVTAAASAPHAPTRRRDRALGPVLLLLAAALVLNSALGPLGSDILAYPLPDSLLNQLLGLEAVTLALVVPALVTAAVLALHDRPGAALLALGPTGYVAYMFVQYVIGPERLAYSPAVLLHLAIATLAGAAGVWCWCRAVTAPGPRISDRTRHARVAWLLLLAAFVVARYLPLLAGSVTSSPIPAEYAEAPSFYWSIVLLDLGAVVPLAVAAAVAVGRDHPAAAAAWFAVVSWFALVPASVAAMAAAMILRDDPQASVATLVITTAASLAFAVPALRAGRLVLHRARATS